MAKAFVIAPVLNEAENLPTLTRSWKELSLAFPSWKFEFVLIDDGSSDGTKASAEKMAASLGLNCRVIRHEQNQGPGAAFASGFTYVAEILRPEDTVITMEGDNTSRIATLKIMLDRMERENVEVALASPYAYGGGIINTSLYRMILSHFANGMVKSFLDIHGIHTMSSFFRAYRGSVILGLQKKWGPRILERNGFECMIELLKKMILAGATITEVPMRLDTSLRKGKSKMKVMRTIRGYFAVIWISRAWK
ncbi:MAG: glycosyltransferase family 2 protein [Bacteriovoracia bacterium]